MSALLFGTELEQASIWTLEELQAINAEVESASPALTIEQAVKRAIIGIFGGGAATGVAFDEAVRKIGSKKDSLSNLPNKRKNAPTIEPVNKVMAKRRRINTGETEDQPDVSADPVEVMSLARVGASDGNPGKNDVRRGETGVENIPVTIYNPWKSTTQVLMPYYYLGSEATVAIPGTAGCVQSLTFRLNSIYDCKLASSPACSGTQITTAPTVDAPDAGASAVEIPQMRNYWTNFYNYWSVVKSRYRFRFRCTSELKDGELMIYQFLHGNQAPPYFSSGSIAVPHQYKRFHGGSYKSLKSQGVVTAGVGAYDANELNWVTFVGEWMPGMIKHDVVEDEMAQTWHRFNEVPPTKEYITYHIQHSPTSTQATALKFICETSIEYIVQLKDLIPTYQFITDATDLAATNFALQTNITHS